MLKIDVEIVYSILDSYLTSILTKKMINEMKKEIVDNAKDEEEHNFLFW